jgi:membrane-associated phospholipid phosphatase
MSFLYLWLGGLSGTSLAVVISYMWLDRPIAFLAHSQFSMVHHSFFWGLSWIPNPLISIAVVVSLAIGFKALVKRAISSNYAAAFVCSSSVLFGEAMKALLKLIFGRTWPESWIGDNPSFIRDGVYGFNFFHGGPWYQSFPSGHMAAVCAVISVLWFWHPKWRLLYMFLVTVVAVGLVGANFHFLSDVIAGSFVGVSSGSMATAIWKSRIARKSVASS